MNGLCQEKNILKGRKLNEYCAAKLPYINLSSSKKSVDACRKQLVHQRDETSVDEVKLKLTKETSSLVSSPVEYALSRPIDVDSNSCPTDASQRTLYVSSKLDDSLNVIVYWADGRGFKFSLVGGKLATVSCLMSLLSDHFGIDSDVFKEACSLWMISNFLEVQLKPHHNPYEIRNNWRQFLKRFTTASDGEAFVDEPLLILKRNVQLSVSREYQLEEKYTNEILTEILYVSAKEEVLSGRYICGIELSKKLAALQMAIEVEPNEEIDMNNVTMFFPSKHRHNFKTLHLFGIPVMGCRGLEMEIWKEYQKIKLKFESKHACRKAYLSVIRETPCYGAAFFRGYVERPSGRSLKEIKKMILSLTFPDIPVLVGISCEYITLIDETTQELLLVQQLDNCDWLYIDFDLDELKSATNEFDYPCFLLIFPDCSLTCHRKSYAEVEMLLMPEKTKLLQVFSKQAIMMEACMNSLSKLVEQKSLDLNSEVSCEQEAESSVTACPQIELVASNGSSSCQENKFRMMDGMENSSSKNDSAVLYYPDSLKCVNNRCSCSFKTSCMFARVKGHCMDTCISSNIDKLSFPLIYSFDKLCLATIDSDGKCLEAQGSLRRILQEVV